MRKTSGSEFGPAGPGGAEPGAPPPGARSRMRAAAWGIGVALAASAALVATTSYASDGDTTVSLTFDDGVRGHATVAAPLLDARGMKGTFYINSGRIGATNFLAQADLVRLRDNGHEIGGHTVDHVDLPTLPEADQKRQICGDRADLIERGFAARNLAYPYGDADATTRRVAEECGYNSARTVGGLKSSTCTNCAPNETAPARNRYMTAASNSVKDTTTLAELQSYVTNAENAGGGWVSLVFHHVCANVCGGTYTIDPTLMGQFLDWLKARQGRGTLVKTVGEVIGGAVKPAVKAAPLPTEPGNMVVNPSLESVGAVNVPACFLRGGMGDNTPTWTRVSPGRIGAYAQRLQVTNYTTGDRKLVTSQSSVSCAPAATPGKSYRVQVYYNGSWGTESSSARMVVYYRDSAGVWKYWRSGPPQPTSTAWRLATLDTPAVPAGATALSYGLALIGPGTLTTDDYHLAVVGQ